MHFGFIAYVLVGGFLALRWPRSIGVHVAAVLWGFGGLLVGWPCPLTALERWARVRAGMSPLPPGGFIAHYLTGVLYPAAAMSVVQALAVAVVVGSWVLCLRRRRARYP